MSVGKQRARFVNKNQDFLSTWTTSYQASDIWETGGYTDIQMDEEFHNTASVPNLHTSFNQ
ncbi:hypothetical protein EYF80_005711 [Liparis tanakae]|uniref:Uncharacterized protein n=1 Tax=Liparis tanakae TaxID=230148 RepID=A0A4Z2J1C2_9TELE|nr:hypothetical protein EYF80_005711 [Liparis tanakae]